MIITVAMQLYKDHWYADLSAIGHGRVLVHAAPNYGRGALNASVEKMGGNVSLVKPTYSGDYYLVIDDGKYQGFNRKIINGEVIYISWNDFVEKFLVCLEINDNLASCRQPEIEDMLAKGYKLIQKPEPVESI